MTFSMNTVLKYQLTVCCSKTCLARDINIKIQINTHTNKTQRLDFLGKERQGEIMFTMCGWNNAADIYLNSTMRI